MTPLSLEERIAAIVPKDDWYPGRGNMMPPPSEEVRARVLALVRQIVAEAMNQFSTMNANAEARGARGMLDRLAFEELSRSLWGRDTFRGIVEKLAAELDADAVRRPAPQGETVAFHKIVEIAPWSECRCDEPCKFPMRGLARLERTLPKEERVIVCTNCYRMVMKQYGPVV